jgi:hypothetical protein
VESARSRELFMSVSLLRGPGEANHRDSVMTSHLPGGKPGSVATDIGSLDMTKRNRDWSTGGRRLHRPERPGHQAAGRQPPRAQAPRLTGWSWRTWPAAHGRRLVGFLPQGRLAEVDDSFTLIPGPASQACACAAHQEFIDTGHTASRPAGAAAPTGCPGGDVHAGHPGRGGRPDVSNER